jgi:hypothetical protein
MAEKSQKPVESKLKSRLTHSAEDKVSKRKYPLSDVKALFAKTGGYCGFPGCGERCIEDATELDDLVVFARIAHIVAHSDVGPRGDPTIGLEVRDSYPNWILLCPTHHDIVDGQTNTYTVAQLRSWKKDHEARIGRALEKEIVRIGFAELQVVTSALLQSIESSATDFSVLPPQDKIDKNSLSAATTAHLRLGLGKGKEVRAYIQQVSKVDIDFPERLKAGLRKEYDRLRDEGASGDALFESMVFFASGGSFQLSRQAAGLAILGYFFEACEVFER